MVEQAGSHTPTASRLDARATQVTRARYARIAAVYDTMEALAEGRYRPWREHFWELVSQLLPPAGRLLESGVGTGKNMSFWPPASVVIESDADRNVTIVAALRHAEIG